LSGNRNDEIGQLTSAFNGLGQQLTSTFRQINTSSRLSALALIGHRLVRQVNVARGEILDGAVHDCEHLTRTERGLGKKLDSKASCREDAK
jgi:methyl-accepting chemotaxis protein